MARQPRFRIASIDNLHRQIKVVSAATRRREMDAAEQLISELDPAGAYPLDYVVFRITGYKGPPSEEPVILAGAALIGDLVALVQRLSASLELNAEQVKRSPITMEDVAARLNVSSKTIQRYRRQGLVCHELRTGDAARLVCFEDALDRFLKRDPAKLARAAKLTRVDDNVVAAMIDTARALKQNEKLSLNEAAARIAAEHGRAHETVRGILKRHDRRSNEPIFAERGPLSDRDQRAILRGWERGIEPRLIAARFDRSPKAVHRIALTMRAQRLTALDLKYITLPTFALPDAESIVLSPATVRSGLNEPPSPGDALALLERFRGLKPLSESDEHALIAGYNILKHRARRTIDELTDSPAAHDVDRIETDLRWAALLKRRLTAHGFAAALERAEQFLHRSLTVEPRDSIIWHIQLAAEAAGRTIETFDPQRGKGGQRVARVCGFAMERALAASERAIGGGRAAARHAPDSLPIEDPLGKLFPWQAWLDVPASWRRRINVINREAARVLEMHYGWAGDAPMTCAEIAGTIGKTPSAVTTIINRGRKALRAAALAFAQ